MNDLDLIIETEQWIAHLNFDTMDGGQYFGSEVLKPTTDAFVDVPSTF